MSDLQLWGAGAFGAIIGWYVYYINRHRRDDVSASDLVTLLGVIGGTAVLKLFPGQTDLFGAYGIGLAVGFFGYFLVMIFLVAVSKNFDADYFLDGRRKKVDPSQYIPTKAEVAGQQGAPMLAKPGDRDGNPGA
ncbi:MAG: hypothetical protein R3B48_29760 [Kofleriaceae bacterium]